MQQFLESGDSSVPVIAVDFRESDSFDGIFEKLGAEVKRMQLPVGDFLCSARLVVERKTRSDFEQSIIDGRLYSQLGMVLDNYERVVVLVEGESAEGRIRREALLGAYATIISDYGATLLFTRNMKKSAEMIFALAKHEQIAKRSPMRIYAKRKTLTPSQTSRAVVESLPSVGPKLAKNLLRHFGTAEAVLKASERELMEVEGMGKKKAKLIRTVLKHHYDEKEDQSR